MQTLNRRSLMFRTLAAALVAPLGGCMKNPAAPATPSAPSSGASAFAQQLQLIVGLAGVALSLLSGIPGTGVSPALAAQITNYIQAVAAGVQAVIAALKSGKPLQKTDAVIQTLAGLAKAPAFTGLVPAQIQSEIQAVALAVDTFVQLQPASVPVTAARGPLKPADQASLDQTAKDAGKLLGRKP